MPVRRIRRSQRFLLGCVLALLLASGLAACSGSADDAPPPVAPETAASPAPAAPVPPAETPRPSTTPEAPVPKPLPDPVAPTASSPPAEPVSSASEPAAMPGEPSPPTAESPAPEPAPLAFRYDTYDRSGAVTEPGHYAFLADGADPASVVTTYEELRDATATALLIHTHDAHGVSQAAFYDDVATGDLVEWKQADDCFVRYTVTAAPAPAAGATARAFGVAWMTYAFTGCSGAIAPASAVTFQWGPLPPLGGTSLTAPILHGPFQLVPLGWGGATVPWEKRDPPAHNRDNPRSTSDLAVARTFPYWRDPGLPDHFVFGYASMDPEDLPYGYVSYWYKEAGLGTGHVQIAGGFLWGRNGSRTAVEGQGVRETRVIAGRPAEIGYSNYRAGKASIIIYDPATEAAYSIRTTNPNFRLENLDALIDLARSLFEPPNPP